MIKTKNFFRAKTVDYNGKVTKQWKFGEIYTELDYGCGFNQFIRETDYENQEELYCPQNDYKISSQTIGQFIGLVDKNGVEIYEGDILLDKEFDENGIDISGYYPVVYDNKTCQFCIDNSFKKDGTSLVNITQYFNPENIEVVGNIYDNPQLIYTNQCPSQK